MVAFQLEKQRLNMIYQPSIQYGDDAHTKISILTDRNIVPSTPEPELTNSEWEELEQLRIENACLKKLKALIQLKARSTHKKK